MSAILATSGAIRSLVDGTLRLTVDIEPRDAQAAFALFGKPGSPVALARVTEAAAVEHDRKAQAQPLAEPLERKPLSLASKVALVCQEMSFRNYLHDRHGLICAEIRRDYQGHASPLGNHDYCAEAVRRLLGVKSRSDILPGTEAAEHWSSLHADYHDWQRRTAA